MGSHDAGVWPTVGIFGSGGWVIGVGREMLDIKQLPPMKTLRPFEAAARHLSFTRAADELCVTQAAVSKQVRALEEHLGVLLFVRAGRTVSLTVAGQALQNAVSLGLTHIAETSAKIRRRQDINRVSLAMRLAFATQFMAPRLSRLKAILPEVDISIVTTEQNPRALLDSVDLAVVLGAEPQPELEADFLFSEEIFPVCSPQYLQGHPELRSIDDIAEQTLLHLDRPIWRDLGWEPIDWSTLLDALECGREIRQTGLHFDNYELVTSAAVNGLGVAVAWLHLARDQLEQGLLVRPIPESYRIDRKHYLVSQRARSEEPLIRLLREWFVRETGKFRTVQESV